jgi:hypothetical protein
MFWCFVLIYALTITINVQILKLDDLMVAVDIHAVTTCHSDAWKLYYVLRKVSRYYR